MEALDAVAALGALGTAAAAAVLPWVRSPRWQAAALAAGLVATPIMLSPIPAALPLAFWLVASLLSGFLVFTADEPAAAGVSDGRGAGFGGVSLARMPLGGGVEAAFVVLGLGLGWAVAPAAGVGRGPSAALAAGVAVAFAAAPLAIFSRDRWRAAISTVLAIQSAGLVSAGLTGTPGPAAMTALALAIVAAAAAGRSVLVLDARSPAADARTGRTATHDPRAGST